MEIRPAFPTPSPADDVDPGMSLRDFFAGLALLALIVRDGTPTLPLHRQMEGVAAEAVGYADHLLLALAQTRVGESFEGEEEAS